MKFKCKLSGCVYEFTTEHDVKTMKEHPDYVEYVEEAVKPVMIKKNKPTVQDAEANDSI